MTVNATAVALAGFAAWTLALLGGIAVLRGVWTITGRRAANAFAVSGDDVSPFSGRLCRAHANCYESLPAFAAVTLLALTTGHSEVTNPLAVWVLGARIAQSVTHLTSTSVRAVQLRFAFFLFQYVVQAVWVVRLFRELA